MWCLVVVLGLVVGWLFSASFFLFCCTGLLYTLGEGVFVKVSWEHFLSSLFLPIWEDEFCGPRRENFLLRFPSSQFSFFCKTVENTVFHPIVLPMFSIPLNSPQPNTVLVNYANDLTIKGFANLLFQREKFICWSLFNKEYILDDKSSFILDSYSSCFML